MGEKKEKTKGGQRRGKGGEKKKKKRRVEPKGRRKKRKEGEKKKKEKSHGSVHHQRLNVTCILHFQNLGLVFCIFLISQWQVFSYAHATFHGSEEADDDVSQESEYAEAPCALYGSQGRKKKKKKREREKKNEEEVREAKANREEEEGEWEPTEGRMRKTKRRKKKKTGGGIREEENKLERKRGEEKNGSERGGSRERRKKKEKEKESKLEGKRSSASHPPDLEKGSIFCFGPLRQAKQKKKTKRKYIQDKIMKEREMQSYIEEREREVAEREAA